MGEGRQGLEQVRHGAAGTGPFKLTRFVPREHAELVRNEAYWDPKRIPKVDRFVLMCAPEDFGRSAA